HAAAKRPSALAAVTEFSSVLFRLVIRSARGPATTSASRVVAAVGLETVRAVWSAIDADHRKNDDSRGLGVRVDIFAAARTQLVGKSNDLAHCNSPLTARGLLEAADVAPFLIKGLARLTDR